jgi:hypothetical protein
MPIINKGIFDTDVVFQRQLGTDWPSVNTNIDLYVEDLIAAGNVIANGLIIRNIEVSDSILTGNISAEAIDTDLLIVNRLEGNVVYAKDYIITDGYLVANGLFIRNIEVSDDVLSGNVTAAGEITGNTLAVDTITANIWNNLYTANVIETAGNLYFTLERAREAYTAGEGITISSNGVIKARLEDAGKGLFNSGMTSADAKISADEFADVSSFSGADGASFIVYSIHATNITSEDAYLSGRYVLGSNNILFANVMRIPGDSSLELIRKAQVFKPSDKVQILSYDSAGNPANNIISVYASYQPLTDDRYVRTGTTISDETPNTFFISDSRPSVVESITVTNLHNDIVPVTIVITDDTDTVKAYLTSNLRLPAKSSVEICEYPKTILTGNKLKINKFSAGDVSVFTSSKYTAEYNIENSTDIINEGQSVVFDINTIGVNSGTTLYYSIEGLQGNITAEDFSTPLTGSFTVTDGSQKITVTANADLNLDIETDEIFKLYVRTSSVSGTVVAMSSNITIKDTSNTSPYSLSEDVTLTYFSNSNISLFIAGINNTETIYYEIEEV